MNITETGDLLFLTFTISAEHENREHIRVSAILVLTVFIFVYVSKSLFYCFFMDGSAVVDLLHEITRENE